MPLLTPLPVLTPLFVVFRFCRAAAGNIIPFHRRTGDSDSKAVAAFTIVVVVVVFVIFVVVV